MTDTQHLFASLLTGSQHMLVRQLTGNCTIRRRHRYHMAIAKHLLQQGKHCTDTQPAQGDMSKSQGRAMWQSQVAGSTQVATKWQSLVTAKWQGQVAEPRGSTPAGKLGACSSRRSSDSTVMAVGSRIGEPIRPSLASCIMAASCTFGSVPSPAAAHSALTIARCSCEPASCAMPPYPRAEQVLYKTMHKTKVGEI